MYRDREIVNVGKKVTDIVFVLLIIMYNGQMILIFKSWSLSSNDQSNAEVQVFRLPYCYSKQIKALSGEDEFTDAVREL